MVEPSGPGRQKQALMLEGRTPPSATQVVSTSLSLFPGGPFSHFISWHHPPRVPYTTNLWSGAEGKDCATCPGSAAGGGGPSTPRATWGGASSGVLGVGLLEKKWTQTSLRKASGRRRGCRGATASQRPEAVQLGMVTGGHPAAAGVSAAAFPAHPHSARFLMCPSPSGGTKAQLTQRLL